MNQPHLTQDGGNELQQLQPASPEELSQATLRQARELLESLSQYFRSATPESWLRDAEELARRQPALALRGAFLLGTLAAREGNVSNAEEAGEPATVRREPAAPANPDLDLREPDDPIGVGSPIGDAPRAGGSNTKGPM